MYIIKYDNAYVLKEDVSLFNYATTKDDKKKKMNRMP